MDMEGGETNQDTVHGQALPMGWANLASSKEFPAQKEQIVHRPLCASLGSTTVGVQFTATNRLQGFALAPRILIAFPLLIAECFHSL